MSQSHSLYDYTRDDEVAANLMALNGADPISVYKRRTATARNFGILAIPIGIFMLVIPPVGIIFIVLGVSALAKRHKDINDIKKELAERQANAKKEERAALKEEVRREMLKEELRAEIEAENSAKKSTSRKKVSKKKKA